MGQFSDTFAMKHAETLAARYLLLPQLSPSAHTCGVGRPADAAGPLVSAWSLRRRIARIEGRMPHVRGPTSADGFALQSCLHNVCFGWV